MTHQRSICPVHDCKIKVPYGQLMCWTCWGRVPQHLRNDIYHAYANHREIGDQDQMKTAIYHELKDQAIAISAEVRDALV